eukprot:GDKK01065275.1.p1 GENE.GDKK01065275.1~~GDKK01065275.1.p1  ORF type:complete len:150 (-),score=32.16 GDKK01065275.1:366-815(-)
MGETANNDDDDDYFEPAEEFDMVSRDSEVEEVEECLTAPSSLMRHVDSVSLLSAYNANDVTPMKKSMSSAMNLAEVAKVIPAASDDPFFYVSLCVPSKESEPLSTREYVSAAAQSKPPRREQGNGFAVACGIFSFTLPIIGYYLMHYSS